MKPIKGPKFQVPATTFDNSTIKALDAEVARKAKLRIRHEDTSIGPDGETIYSLKREVISTDEEKKRKEKTKSKSTYRER